ncbi:MAG: rhodanese-like domain-containing protein, partial [Kofleriaceae bacterium]
MPTFDTLLREIRTKTPEVEVAQLGSELKAGDHPAIIDVREADEHVQGAIAGATHIPRGFLELRIERAVQNHEAPVVLYCQG